MKQGVKAIKGKNEIKPGVWETYTVSEWYPDTPEEKKNEANVTWQAHKINPDGSLTLAIEKKEGVFRFGQAGIGSNYKIVAFLNTPEFDNASSIAVKVVATEKPDITSIVLSDAKGVTLTKPLSAGQIVNAHVNTVGMTTKHKVVISLWEDEKESHKLLQEKSVFVGSMGVAHAQFVIPYNFVKKMEALMGKASSEVSYHITAYALGELSSVEANKMKARGEKAVLPEERKKQTQEHLENKTKTKTTTPPYKGKVTTPATKPKTSPLAESGGISAVYFVDKAGKKITKNTTNNLRVIVESQGLIDREINLKLWEDDTYAYSDDDFLFEKNYTITSNKNYIDIPLTKEMQEKGYEFGEGWEQELYVKIHVLNFYPKIKSTSLKIDFTSKTIDVPDGVSTVKVGKTDVEKDKNECFCKLKENQFYWSDKINCDGRKKVLQVASELWGESKKTEKASELMSIFHLETATTFSPSADNGRGYSGLLQFSDDVAIGLGTTRSKLKAMTFIEQMDYVKKYLQKNKDKLATLTDFYLQVIKPNAVGQGKNPDYILFDESISVPDGDGSKTSQAQRMLNIQKEPWVTKYGYSSNPTFMLEKEEKTVRKKWVYTRQRFEQRAGFINGKTTVGEVTKVVKQEHYDKGKPVVFMGKCENLPEEKGENKQIAPWVPFAMKELKTYGGVRQIESPLKERVVEYFKVAKASWYDHTGYWCGAFVKWCFAQTENYNTVFDSYNSVTAFNWLPKIQTQKLNSNLKGCIDLEHINSINDIFVGAIIVFDYSHVAFVIGESTDGTLIYYLGGNQSDKAKNDGPGKRTICIGKIFKTGINKKFWLSKPISYKPSDEEKKLPKLTVTAYELNNASTR